MKVRARLAAQGDHGLSAKGATVVQTLAVRLTVEMLSPVTSCIGFIGDPFLGMEPSTQRARSYARARTQPFPLSAAVVLKLAGSTHVIPLGVILASLRQARWLVAPSEKEMA